MSVRNRLLLAMFGSMALVSTPAAAQVLTFEGVGDFAQVGNFYNGGAGGNLGITFGSSALGLIDVDAGGSGNFANEPSPNTGLFFISGNAAVMNVLSGFDTGFSFFYSAINQPGVVNVYSGSNATGSILASISLPTNGGNCSGDPTGSFCNFSPVGVTFAGTAFSVGFGGTQNQIVFDNITLGSSTPIGAVPEPGTWAMMLLGFGAIGGALRRRRQRVLALA